jgi:hypothetical protein
MNANDTEANESEFAFKRPDAYQEFQTQGGKLIVAYFSNRSVLNLTYWESTPENGHGKLFARTVLMPENRMLHFLGNYDSKGVKCVSIDEMPADIEHALKDPAIVASLNAMMENAARHPEA